MSPPLSLVVALSLGSLFSLGIGPTAHAQSLDARDPVEIERAIAAAAQPGDRARAQQLSARIDAGLPAPLLTRAVDALVANGSPPAVSALRALAGHRRAAIRAQSARGLARIRGANARDVLAALLDDPEAEVRSAAAIALGTLGPQGVMDTVMLAALRGVSEAAILFAQQANPQDVARFVRRLDAATLEPTAPAVRILIARANLPRPSRLALVAKLRELGTGLPQTLLREVGATLPEGDPVRRAIDEALAALDAPAPEAGR